MNTNIPIARTVSIRECGLDEYWLQDQIVTIPSSLGLGELEVLYRERKQSSGGRLDILLKNPEDDTMYEVEVMLGETDESHIIRTIEYWDNEKRKWPQRQHYAVLVAESITRRFFNVIQLFSHSIPLIAIQANIIEAEGNKILNFSKILDTYEEPEDSITISNETYDENYWQTKAPWTIDAAKALLNILTSQYGPGSISFVKSYINVIVKDSVFFWLHKRVANKSLVSFWVGEALLPEASAILDGKDISYVKKTKSIRITVDKDAIQKHSETFKEIAKLVNQAYEL